MTEQDYYNLNKINIFAWIVGTLIVIFTLFSIFSCASEKTPDHINDAIKCKLSAYNICGRQDIQSQCMQTAQRECMYWAGYRLKKDRIVKPTNNCDAESK